MKNKLIYILILIACSFLLIDKAFAGESASINVTAKGTGSATLTISTSGAFAQIYGTFSCGNLGSKSLDYVNNVGEKISKKVYTISWSGAKAGNYTCSVSGLQVGDLAVPDAGVHSVSVSSKSFTISSSASYNKSSSSSSNKNTSNKNNKSSDNTLKSLGIEGQKIDFDKNKDTYDVSLENGITKIKINAEVSDSKAKLEGTGEKDVKEGDNKFEIKVTAENGDIKTYVLNVNVDTKPIKVNVDGKEFTLIKKKNELPSFELEHEDITLNFDGVDVPAYRIDKISYLLVGLKDEEGKIELYKYDTFKDHEKPDEYTLFKMFTGEKNYISYLEFPKELLLDNYKKYKEKINDVDTDVYKMSKDSDFCLFYGVNILTGEKNIYRYDLNEKTIQIYDKTEIDKISSIFTKKITENNYIIAGLIGACAFLLIVILILCVTRKRKVKKMIKKYEVSKKLATAQNKLNEIKNEKKEQN